LTLVYRSEGGRRHLKNVYGTLSLSLLSALAGAVLYFISSIAVGYWQGDNSLIALILGPIFGCYRLIRQLDMVDDDTL